MVRRTGKWAVGPDRYVEKINANAGQDEANPGAPLTGPPASEAEHEAQVADTGVYWDDIDVSAIKPSGLDRARHRFRSRLPDLIWNAARLEGNNFTLPEVRTLLDGVTVGGKSTDDENQILALSEAYNTLDKILEDGTFSVSKEVADRINGIVAKHEAIESGHFRGEGEATGGGTVNLSNGGSVPGTPHGEGGILLRQRFHTLTERLDEIDDVRVQGLVYFASATRSQFYFDGNKRTSRLVMTGILMKGGYDAINVPYARKLEFNHALDRLFETDDATELIHFLASCTD